MPKLSPDPSSLHLSNFMFFLPKQKQNPQTENQDTNLKKKKPVGQTKNVQIKQIVCPAPPPTQLMELVSCWPATPGHSLPWTAVVVASDTPLGKADFAFPSRCHLRTASWLGVILCVPILSSWVPLCLSLCRSWVPCCSLCEVLVSILLCLEDIVSWEPSAPWLQFPPLLTYSSLSPEGRP